MLFLFSCRTSRLQTSIEKNTTFVGDSLFFKNENLNNQFYYPYFSGITGLSFDIKKDSSTKIYLKKPALIQYLNNSHIVFPGEKIIITSDNNSNILFKTTDNPKRDKEFLFEDEFNNLNNKIGTQEYLKNSSLPVDSLLLSEKKIKEHSSEYIYQSDLLFDSLAQAYQISDTFKFYFNQIKNYNKRSYLFNLYYECKQQLKEVNLYDIKMLDLLPFYNQEKSKILFDLGETYITEFLAEILIKKRLNSCKNDVEVKDAFYLINANFFNFSKDFILTKILYHSISNRIKLSSETLAFYYSTCEDTEYKKTIKNLIKEIKLNSTKSLNKKDNRLISFSNSKVFTIEEIFKKYRGKLILLDFWASWCAPCREQLPFIKNLSQEFSKDKIVVLYLSMDRNLLVWRNTKEEISYDDSYIFENFEKQSFIKNHNIETIPRYILIDKKGHIITDDAPHPDNPELKKLIEQNLEK